MDINMFLKRAADFRDLTVVDDQLDALISEVLNDEELSENDLYFVAAARNEPKQNIQTDDKK